MENKEIINLVNIMYGHFFKVIELHWNTKNQAEHLLTSDIYSSIVDYADKLVENCSGMYGKPGMDIMKPIKCTNTSTKDILTELRNQALAVRNKLTKPMFNGTNVILDDLNVDLNKWIFLSENK